MTDLFDQNNQPTPVANNVSSDPLADKLKEIVNEQGQPKYKDSLAAWEALKASQDHIKRLEDEAKARQAEVDKAREEKVRADALEAIVNKLSNNNSPAPTPVVTPTNSGTSEEATVKLLERVLEQREAQAAAKRNASSVNDALLAKFGDKAKEVVATKAKELGMTPQELGEFSSRSPQMVLQVFGLTGSVSVTPSPTPPSPSPLNPPRPDTGIKMPERSLISGIGATEAAQAEVMAQIKKRVYERLNVET